MHAYAMSQAAADGDRGKPGWAISGSRPWALSALQHIGLRITE